MFLRNRWYVAGWADQFGHELRTRTILEEPIVFFRTKQGEVTALADRCPHRLVPLSRGTLIGNSLQCGYHGLVVGSDGHCTRVPTSGTVPDWGHVKRYPVAELDGYIWVWMGAPERADTNLITRFPCNTDPKRAMSRGETRIEAHYQLIVDNLLDLSHAQYLHADSLGNADFYRAKSIVQVEATTVWDRRTTYDTTPPPAFAHILGPDKRVDFWMDARVTPPGEYFLDVGLTPSGRPREEGGQIDSVQLLTPETRTSTLYHWNVCRNYDIGNGQLTEIWAQAVAGAFQFDKVMIEAQQRSVGSHEIVARGGHNVAADESGVAARRIIEQLLAAERTLSSAA